MQELIGSRRNSGLPRMWPISDVIGLLVLGNKATNLALVYPKAFGNGPLRLA